MAPAKTFIVPPLTASVSGVTLTPLLTLVVPPLVRMVPAPVAVAPLFSSCVPPPNCTIALASAVKLPSLVPPPSKLRVPVWPSTAPALLNARSISESPVPATLRTIPVDRLLNVAVPPETVPTSPSPEKIQVPELLMTESGPIRKNAFV